MLTFNRASESVMPSFAARQMGYSAQDATCLSGRGLEEISSTLGQNPQSTHPHIKQRYCQKASGYPKSFTHVSSHTYASLERLLHFSSPSGGASSTG